MKTVRSKRIVKVLIDDKHRKSFPLFMADYIQLIPADTIFRLSKGMRLTDKDKESVSQYVYNSMVAKYLIDLKKSEPYVYDVIKNADIVGSRKINLKYSPSYYETLFNNEISVKCPDYIFEYSTNKLQTINRNY